MSKVMAYLDVAMAAVMAAARNSNDPERVHAEWARRAGIEVGKRAQDYIAAGAPNLLTCSEEEYSQALDSLRRAGNK